MVEPDQRFFFVQEFAGDVFILKRGFLQDFNHHILAHELHVFGEINQPDAAFVRAATGYAIGGIPPLGHATAMETLIDPDLLQYDTVWAAAGTPHAVFPVDPHELVRATGGRVLPVAAAQP